MWRWDGVSYAKDLDFDAVEAKAMPEGWGPVSVVEVRTGSAGRRSRTWMRLCGRHPVGRDGSSTMESATRAKGPSGLKVTLEGGPRTVFGTLVR